MLEIMAKVQSHQNYPHSNPQDPLQVSISTFPH